MYFEKYPPAPPYTNTRMQISDLVLAIYVRPTLVRRNNGEAKKFSVGVLQLNTEVVHYIVPSKEPAAYLQAKVRTPLPIKHWALCSEGKK